MVSRISNLVHKKLNESYTVIDGPLDTLRAIFDYLKVERPDAYFDTEIQAGLKSPYVHFASVQHQKLLVMNGHVDLLKHWGIYPEKETPDITEMEIDLFLAEIKKILPFPPYDFQEKAFKESLLNKKQINKMCTSSGKSMTISLIAEFFRRRGQKGLILVPNINLLTQFKSDISEYNLSELHENTHIIGDGCNDRHFDKPLTISTWQSLLDFKHDLDQLDFVITDEAHRFASEETSAIVRETINCKYKWGFTGTLPEDPTAKMQLLGLFGMPITYITSKELIERGLATPIHINSVIVNYDNDDKKIFREIKPSGRSKNKYPNQLQFLKDHEKRNELITNLSCRVKQTGNTLLLFQHTNHGKFLFTEIMRKLHPDVEVKNKDITGKKSFEFQEKYGVYFLNGEDNSETREKTRKILEEHSDAILVANYALLSTGVSIKRLHNMILGSPMKAYTTITQSIGRLMRLHPSKKLAQIFDIVDVLNPHRKPAGVFYKQYQHRCGMSYNPEEFPIFERHIQF